MNFLRFSLEMDFFSSGDMLFVMSCNQIFVIPYLFLQIVSIQREQKHRVPEISYNINDFTNVIKIMRII